MNSQYLKSQIESVDQTESRLSPLFHIFTERFNSFFDLIKKYEDTDPKSEYRYKNEGDDETKIEDEAEVLSDLFDTLTQGEKNETIEQLKEHIIKMCDSNDNKYEEANIYPAYAQNYFNWL